MEVVYQGIRLTPDQIAAAARDEDVDIVGLSILSGSHLELVPETLRRIRAEASTPPWWWAGSSRRPTPGPSRPQGIARVYTPKDYELAAIMDDLTDLAAEYRENRAKSLH